MPGREDKMRTTTANLKHLYQCRGFWWYYLVFAMFATQMVLYERIPFGRLWFGLINVMAGIGISMLQKEILSRPFTYCLPGHRPIPRRLIFGFSIVFNLLLSLLIILRNDTSQYSIFIIILSAFSFGLTFYMLAVLCSLIPRNTNLFPVVVAGLVAVLFLVKSAPYNLMRGLPVLLPATAAIASAAACLLLRGQSLARKFCGRPVQGFSIVSKTAQRKARRAAYAKQSVNSSPWVHELFLARIGSSGHTTMARSIWSDLYFAFATALSHWKASIVLFAATSLGSAYLATFRRPAATADSPILVSFAVILSLAAMSVRLPAYSYTPALTGRRQRFYGTLTIAVLMTALMILLLIIMAGTAALLELALPSVFATFPFARFTLVPLATVPAILALNLFFTAPPVKGLLTVVFFFLFFGLCVRFEYVFTLVLIISACAWIVFILIARHACMKRCLVQ